VDELEARFEERKQDMQEVKQEVNELKTLFAWSKLGGALSSMLEGMDILSSIRTYATRHKKTKFLKFIGMEDMQEYGMCQGQTPVRPLRASPGCLSSLTLSCCPCLVVRALSAISARRPH
jgi:hypothetical protein